MPYLTVRPEAEIHISEDVFAEAWTTPETVLLVHGLAESVEAWRPWVPHLARHNRVIRMDQRGFGRSTPMPEDFAWSVDVLAADIAQVIEQLAPGGAHLVAAKVAGPMAIRATSSRPELIKSLSLIGTPILGPQQPDWLAQVEQESVRAWAAATMDARLEGMSREAKDYWIDLMAATPRSTMLGFLRFVGSIDVRDDLPRLQCPTLVVGADSKRRGIAQFREWQETIPDSRLVTAPGSGYHAATTEADFCAQAVASFIAERAG